MQLGGLLVMRWKDSWNTGKKYIPRFKDYNEPKIQGLFSITLFRKV